MTKTNSIDVEILRQRAARLVGTGLLLATVLLPATLTDGQRSFATPQEAVQATIDAAGTTIRRRSSNCSARQARTSSNPATLPKTKTSAPSLHGPLTKSSRLNRSPHARSCDFHGGNRGMAISSACDSQGRKMATGSCERPAGDSGAQDRQERIERNGGVSRLCGGADGVCCGSPRRRSCTEIRPEDRQHAGQTRWAVFEWRFPTNWCRRLSQWPKRNSPAAGKKTEPYHGYYFRVLKSQGPDAAGGPLTMS